MSKSLLTETLRCHADSDYWLDSKTIISYNQGFQKIHDITIQYFKDDIIILDLGHTIPQLCFDLILVRV